MQTCHEKISALFTSRGLFACTKPVLACFLSRAWIWLVSGSPVHAQAFVNCKPWRSVQDWHRWRPIRVKKEYYVSICTCTTDRVPVAYGRHDKCRLYPVSFRIRKVFLMPCSRMPAFALSGWFDLFKKNRSIWPFPQVNLSPLSV
jgi:hypothetical protein